MTFADAAVPVPEHLATAEFSLRPITADDAAADHAAVMDSREELRRWEQSTWPADDFTVEANRVDLADLEQRHGEHRAFTFTVRDPADTECLGCVYVFPPTATFLARAAITPLGSDAWDSADAVVYFWVRTPRVADGLDDRLLTELRRWFAEDWGLGTVRFVTNEQFSQQVALLDATDLARRFELRESEKPGAYLVYG